MVTQLHMALLWAAPVAADTQSPVSTDWLTVLLPAIVVALVSALFQYHNSGQIKRLEAKLASKTGFFMRKLEVHEKLWPLVAACNRAQSTLTRQRGQGGFDLAPAAQDIAERRKEMKNFVYDNGLYFDQTVRTLVQDLDTQLGDPDVRDVRQSTQELESKLRDIVSEIT